MRLALVIASDYHRSAQLPTLSRSLEDADRFAAYLDGSDLEIAIEELSADRYFPEQFEAALREPSDPPAELIVYFAGYVVTAPGRDPSLILDGDRLGAFALPRLRRLLEEMASRVLVECVRAVHAGGTWGPRVTGTPLAPPARDEAQPLQGLTTREVEVAGLVALGLRNRDIAERLAISEGTVKIHLHNIYEKLGIEGRSQLVRLASRHGLV